MKNLELINNNVHKEVNENSILIELMIDIENTSPFMCSPFFETWIWSNNTKDLNNYLYDLLIPEYLINVLIAYGIELENDYYSFDEAITVYKNSIDNISSEKINSLNILKSMYEKYIYKETTYLEFIKMLIKLERILLELEINFKTISYANPYEARYSKSLKTERFDFENLEKNFKSF